jgi:hypothetical protein
MSENDPERSRFSAPAPAFHMERRIHTIEHPESRPASSSPLNGQVPSNTRARAR